MQKYSKRCSERGRRIGMTGVVFGGGAESRDTSGGGRSIPGR